MTVDRSLQGSGEPAVFAFPISPSDADYLPFVPRAVYVGGSGNLAVMTAGLDIVVLVGVAVGSVLPVRVIKVFATGTTATNLVGFY